MVRAEGGVSGEAALQQAPAEFLHPPIMLGPLDDCVAAESTATLLVLAPGALLSAEDFRQLAVALQDASKTRVRLTVGIIAPNWQAMMAGNALGMLNDIVLAGADQVIAAAGQHMELKAGNTGRQDNVFVAGHSALGPCLVRYALERAGGLMLLASTMLPASSDTFPTASTWIHPVLNLTGELDGQQPISKQSFAFLDAAQNAARLGLRHVAAFQPVIFVPGMNHMQFGPGTTPDIDLAPDVSHDEAIAAASAVMADFLAAHRGDSAADAAAATDALQRQFMDTAAIVGPFIRASGRGDVEKLLEALAQQPELPNADALGQAGCIPRAVGGESLAGDQRKWLEHPGGLAAAEEFAEAVQREALSALPPQVLERVIISPTAHTDEAAFLYNQPTLDPLPGGRALLRPCVYRWSHFLETAERVQPAVGAEYALKMRTAGTVARVLGEHALADKLTRSDVSAAAVNDRTLQAALEQLPPATRRRYEARGKKWRTVADRPVASPPDFVRKERVLFTDVADAETEISGPCVCTQKEGEPVPRMPSYSRGPGRFAGNHYIKVLSPARALEWLMVDALRPRKDHPVPAPPSDTKPLIH